MKSTLPLLAALAIASVLQSLPAAELLTSAPWQKWDKTWTFVAQDEDIAAGGWLTVSFKAGWKNMVKERPFYAWSGVVFDANALDPNGKKLYLKTLNLGDGTKEPEEYSMKFLVPKDSRRLTVILGPMQAKGEFSLTGLNVSLAPLDAQYPSIVLNGKSHEYDERGKPPRAPAAIASDTVFSLFRIDSPRMTFDRFLPEQSQLTNGFSVTAAPGETALVFVGVAAAADMRLSATYGDFIRVGTADEKLKASAEILRANNRPNNAGRGQTYWIAPEVLLPLDACADVKKDGSAQTVVRFRIADDAAPGDYEGTISYAAGGKTRTANVRLTVLPFKVTFPKPSDYQEILHVGWYADDPAVLAQVCRDAKARGCESLLIACQYGRGRLQLERKDGRLAVRSFDRFDHALAAFRAADMTGTFYVHFSDKLEVAVAQALGIDFPDAGGEQTNMIPEMDTADFKAAVVEALQLLRTRAAGVNLAVLGMDEPDNGDRAPRAKWEIARIREAGIPSCLYAGAKSYDLAHPAIVLGSVRPLTPVYDHFKAETAKHGTLLCRYGGTGSYGFAFGGLMPSRLLHGWGEYLLPESKGHTIWTVQIDPEYDPTSLDHFNSYGSVYQRYRGKLLTSLQLEGCYEGLLDYAYLKELDRRLAANAGTETATRISVAFARLKERMQTIVPYGLDADLCLDPEKAMKQRFTNADAVRLRTKIAAWIVELASSRLP